MPIKTMDAAGLKQALEQEEVIVVDVREPDEYEQNHILGTTLIPLSTVSAEAIPMQAGQKLVLHCRSGARSHHACELLTEQDPSLEVYNLEGGILAWMALGYPVEGSDISD